MQLKQERSGWPWTNEVSSGIYKGRGTWPKISIITPSFNQGKYIEETIYSVLRQNYPNLEYIIIDGGSTDNTLEVLKKYEPWLTYWVSEKDNGQSHAINKGLGLATGEIMHWLNSDDLLVEKALYHIADHFCKEDESVAFIYGQCVNFDVSGDWPFSFLPSDNLPLRYYYSFPYAQPSCFFKKSALLDVGLLDESFQFAMDFDLFIRIALRHKMKQVPEVISKFRRHQESKSSTLSHVNKEECLRIFSTLLASLQAAEHISLMQNLGLYIPPSKEYHLGREISKSDIDFITASFLKKYIAEWYDAGQVKKAAFACSLLCKLGGNLLLKQVGLGKVYVRVRYLGSDLILLLRKLKRTKLGF